MEKITYQSKSGVFSTQLAIASFAIGTLLLLLGKYFPNEYSLVAGALYVVGAFVVNAAVLLVLVYFFLAEPENREYYAIKILILLANIPIAVLYFYLILECHFFNI